MSWCLTLMQIMADRGGPRGDRGRGDRGRGRGPRRPRGKKDDEEKWVPCTKLGRLVQQVGHMQHAYHAVTPPRQLFAHDHIHFYQHLRRGHQTWNVDGQSLGDVRKGTAGMQGKIKSLEQIFLFSLPVKEYQIVESFLQSSLKDEVMKIMPVQKQTRAGQRTRFKVRAVLIKEGLQNAEVGLKQKDLHLSMTACNMSSWLPSKRPTQLPEWRLLCLLRDCSANFTWPHKSIMSSSCSCRLSLWWVTTMAMSAWE